MTSGHKHEKCRVWLLQAIHLGEKRVISQRVKMAAVEKCQASRQDACTSRGGIGQPPETHSCANLPGNDIRHSKRPVANACFVEDDWLQQVSLHWGSPPPLGGVHRKAKHCLPSILNAVSAKQSDLVVVMGGGLLQKAETRSACFATKPIADTAQFIKTRSPTCCPKRQQHVVTPKAARRPGTLVCLHRTSRTTTMVSRCLFPTPVPHVLYCFICGSAAICSPPVRAQQWADTPHHARSAAVASTIRSTSGNVRCMCASMARQGRHGTPSPPRDFTISIALNKNFRWSNRRRFHQQLFFVQQASVGSITIPNGLAAS